MDNSKHKDSSAWYSINASSEESASATILIYGDIGESWHEETTSAQQFVADISDIDASAISIRINSYGGSVPDALAIFNAIRRHPAKVTTHIDGVAMSAASLIAMAGDAVHMAENGMLMIHGPHLLAHGNAPQLREMAGVLDKWAEAMAHGYASRNGQDYAGVLSMLQDGKDHYFTSGEALSAGYIDVITQPMAVAASSIHKETLARFGTAYDKQIQPGDNMKAKEEQAVAENALPEQTQANAGESGKPEAASGHELDREEIEKAAVSAALRAERKRRAAVGEKFKAFASHPGMSDLQARCMDDPGVSADQAAQKILALLSEGVEPVAGHVVVRPNEERTKYHDGIVACLLARAGKADSATREQAKASGVLNLSLMEQAKASLSRAGVDFSSLNSTQIARAALTQSTSDFPVLLENAMHKALLGGYRGASDTWSRFCSVGSVSDFRAHGRYRTGSIGNYQTVNEGGEYQNVAIPDGEKQTITAVDRGLIINLTYQMIVNDDLGAFVGLAADLGRAGRRTIEAAVYALLAENSGLGPNLIDGNPLFHARANANNIGAGAALSAASIEADRVVMGSQMDVSGNDFLDLRPAVWLGPLASGATARTINDAQYDPDTANKLQKPNAVRGLFSDIVDTPRLSGTRYYLFASPMDAPVIEVAFVNGEQEPYIVMEEAFTSRGASYRATLDFGVAAVGYRGAVTNAGA